MIILSGIAAGRENGTGDEDGLQESVDWGVVMFMVMFHANTQPSKVDDYEWTGAYCVKLS